jgi:hypothetical protein
MPDSATAVPQMIDQSAQTLRLPVARNQLG